MIMMRTNQKILILMIIFGMTISIAPISFAVSQNDPLVYIRDMTRVEGLQENTIYGIGLVIGLNGTGDTRFSPTSKMMSNLMNNYGLIVDANSTRAKNAAVVHVMATLPPFSRMGDSLDVVASSMGDAKSLQGGTLMVTALKAPNGETYAHAQGPVSIGGFGADGGGGNSVQQNHLQVARIPNGASVIRTLEPDFTGKTEIDFLLENPNFETATLVTQVVNNRFQNLSKKDDFIAQSVNAGRVRVKIPFQYRNDVVNFISQIQGLQVRASMPAKVVINERTGTIVIGHDVRISTVAVAHGNLTVTITTQKSVIESSSDDGTTTNVTTETNTDVNVNVQEEENQLVELRTGASVSDVVRALNAIGAAPRDIISILQSMKTAGALHADLELI